MRRSGLLAVVEAEAAERSQGVGDDELGGIERRTTERQGVLVAAPCRGDLIGRESLVQEECTQNAMVDVRERRRRRSS